MQQFAPKKKTTSAPQQKPTSNKEFLTKMVDLIDIKYCDNRDTWLKIICAMKKCGCTQEEARKWSVQSDRYTESGFESTWDSYPVDLITATEATIRHYAKLSNPTEYYKMTAEPFPTDPTERDFSEFFWELAGDCCIVSNNTMYLYYRNQWRIIDKKETHILRTMIGDTIRNHFEKILINVESNGFITKVSNTARFIAEMCKRNKLNNVTSFVMDKMYSEHCDTEDIFDNKPYIFAFKNKAFDLKTGQEYTIRKEDFITQNTKHEL